MEQTYTMHVKRVGRKQHHMTITATQRQGENAISWVIHDKYLPFGPVKANAAAKVYFELWQIKEGGE